MLLGIADKAIRIVSGGTLGSGTNSSIGSGNGTGNGSRSGTSSGPSRSHGPRTRTQESTAPFLFPQRLAFCMRNARAIPHSTQQPMGED